MRKAASKSSPGATERSPSPDSSAFVGAVIGSKQIRSSPAGAYNCAVGVAAHELDLDAPSAAR